MSFVLCFLWFVVVVVFLLLFFVRFNQICASLLFCHLFVCIHQLIIQINMFIGLFSSFLDIASHLRCAIYGFNCSNFHIVFVFTVNEIRIRFIFGRNFHDILFGEWAIFYLYIFFCIINGNDRFHLITLFILMLLCEVEPIYIPIFSQVQNFERKCWFPKKNEKDIQSCIISSFFQMNWILSCWISIPRTCRHFPGVVTGNKSYISLLCWSGLLFYLFDYYFRFYSCV